MKKKFCDVKNKDITSKDCKDCPDKKEKKVFFTTCEHSENHIICDKCNEEVQT